MNKPANACCAECKACFVSKRVNQPPKYCPSCRKKKDNERQRIRYSRVGRRDRAVGRTIPAWGDTVEALCWCGENIVMVHASEVRACRTGSCGLPECGPEHPLVIHNRFGA